MIDVMEHGMRESSFSFESNLKLNFTAREVFRNSPFNAGNMIDLDPESLSHACP
jgi:hypothetical protein